MEQYSICRNEYKQYMFGKWIDVVCGERKWFPTDKCNKCGRKI